MMNKRKIGIVTPYPPSKTTLNEYGYHLVKHFKTKEEVAELQIYAERLPDNETYEDDPCLKIIPCWKFNHMMNLSLIHI